MAAISFTKKGNTGEQVNNQWLGIIRPDYHPFPGYRANRQGVCRTVFHPQCRHAWFFLPAYVFKRGSQNMRFVNDDPKIAASVTSLYRLWMIFCSIFGISAQNSSKVVFGESTRREERHFATATVPLFDTETKGLIDKDVDDEQQEEDDDEEKKKESTQGDFKGIIFHCTFLISDEEMKTESLVDYEPNTILVRKLDQSKDQYYGRATGNYSRSYKNGHGGAPSKKAAADVTCEQEMFFRNLNTEDWRRWVSCYIRPGISGDAFSEEKYSGSCYNFWNVFSWSNMVQNATVAKVPMWYFTNHWSGFLGGPHDTEVNFPCEGRHTYRFNPRNYSPQTMSVAYFPHIVPPKPSMADPVYVRFLRQFMSDPEKYEKLPTTKEELKEFTAQMTVDERYEWDRCVHSANYAHLQTVGSLDSDDGSLEAGFEISLHERKLIQDKHTAAFHANKEKWTAETYAELRIRQENDWNAWSKAKVHEYLSRYTESNKSLSMAQSAAAKWMNDRISTKPKGPFSFPATHKFQLSDTGNILANMLLECEMVDKSYVNHRVLIMAKIAALSVPILGSNNEMPIHMWLFGDHGKGKSELNDRVKEGLAEGTVMSVSASSAKAEMYAGNRHNEWMVVQSDEADPEKNGLRGHQQMGAGQNTASGQANSSSAAIEREIMSRGEVAYHRQELNPQTNKYEGKRILVKMRCAFFKLINGWRIDLAPNHLDRGLWHEFKESDRADITMTHIFASLSDGRLKEMRRHAALRSQRNQVLIFWISILTRGGILPIIDTTVTDSLFMEMRLSMAKRGIKKSSEARASNRVRMIIYVLVYLRAIYHMFDSPQRIFGEDETWDKQSFEKLLNIRYFLFSQKEDLVFALTLASNEWENSSLSTIVCAIRNHHAIQLPIEDVASKDIETEEEKNKEAADVWYQESVNAGGILNPNEDTPFLPGDDFDEQKVEKKTAAAAATAVAKTIRQPIPPPPPPPSKKVTPSKKQGRADEGPPPPPPEEKKKTFTKITKSLPKDPENIELGEEIIRPDYQDRLFVYFEVMHQSSSKYIPGKGNINYGEHDEGETMMTNQLMDKLARHVMVISNQLGTNIAFIKSMLYDMSSTRVEIDKWKKAKDGKYVKDGAIKVEALRFFNGIGEHCKQVYLRLSRRYLAHQQTSVVEFCVAELIRSHGFKQSLYVTGMTETDQPYMWKTLSASPNKTNLSIVNPFYRSEIADEIVRDVIFGGDGKDSTVASSSSLMKPQDLAELEYQRIRVLAFNQHNHGFNLEKFFASIRINKSGFIYRENCLVDYKGRPVTHQITDPEYDPSYFKEAMAADPKYHSKVYHKNNVRLHYSKPVSEETMAIDMMRISMNVNQLNRWNDFKDSITFDPKEGKLESLLVRNIKSKASIASPSQSSLPLPPPPTRSPPPPLPQKPKSAWTGFTRVHREIPPPHRLSLDYQPENAHLLLMASGGEKKQKQGKKRHVDYGSDNDDDDLKRIPRQRVDGSLVGTSPSPTSTSSTSSSSPEPHSSSDIGDGFSISFGTVETGQSLMHHQQHRRTRGYEVDEEDSLPPYR